MTIPFCHLRVRSDFSFGYGVSKISSLLKAAKVNKQPALAITDTNVLHGALKFSTYAAKEGVQPIMGTRISVAVGQHVGSLTLLAADADGFRTIRWAVHDASNPEDGPRGVLSSAAFERLLASPKGVVVLAGVGGSPDDSIVSKLYRGQNGTRAAGDLMVSLLDAFGRNYFVEICRNDDDTDDAVELERFALDIALRHGIPLVATTDVYYADAKGSAVYEVNRKLATIVAGTPPSVMVSNGEIQRADLVMRHLRPTEEMLELFADIPEAVENTSVIARRCTFRAANRKPILPPYDRTSDKDEATQLREKARAGLEVRLAKLQHLAAELTTYRERLEFELGVIEKMEFPGYFLIVADFIKYAKDNDIPVGPGRGSGAGSVAAWALGITDLDPLRWGLLFERFLNPDRVSMPDFDVDFCQERRGEVIEYVRNRYQPDHVAQIVTFGGRAPRSAIKDAGRVIQSNGTLYSPYELFQISSLIHPVKTKSLEEAYSDTAFRTRVNQDEKSKDLYAVGKSIEGVLKTTGVHAAGIVIGREPIVETVPVAYDPKEGFLTSQYDMKDVESAGLVKFDFLGLKNMTMIKHAVDEVRRVYGVEIDLDVIPFDDAPTFDLFAKGAMDGVFQFASAGMKKALKLVRPDKFEDLIAVVSLYRPGPMENIPVYAARKNGQEEIVEIHPAISTIMNETQGVIIYQEQVMQIARELAGYTLGEADLLRRAMGKKIRSEMDAQRSRFVQGAMENDCDEQKANAIFDLLAKFADYGFNKSHAAAYALIAYWTGWFKANYPAAFFASLMTYDEKARPAALKEMAGYGIDVLPLDVNASDVKFRVERMPDGKIGLRFGFCAAKNLQGAQAVVDERKAGGPFKSVVDFIGRMDVAEGSIPRSARQIIALVGAFSEVPLEHGSRDRTRNAPANGRKVAYILGKIGGAKKKEGPTTGSLFGSDLPSVTIPPAVLEKISKDEYGDEQKSLSESKIFGFYMSAHPLDEVYDDMRMCQVKRLESLVAAARHMPEGILSGENVITFGLVRDVRKFATTKGRSRVSFTLEGKDQSFSVSVNDPLVTQKYKDVDRCVDALKELSVQNTPCVLRVEVTCREDQSPLVRCSNLAHVDDFLTERRAGWNHVVEVDLLNYAAMHKCSTQEEMDLGKHLMAQAEIFDTIPAGLAMEIKAFVRKYVDLPEVVETVRGLLRNDEVDPETYRGGPTGTLSVLMTYPHNEQYGSIMVGIPGTYAFKHTKRAMETMSFARIIPVTPEYSEASECLFDGEDFKIDEKRTWVQHMNWTTVIEAQIAA